MTGALQRLAHLWAWSTLGGLTVVACFVLGRRLDVTIRPSNAWPIVVASLCVAATLFALRRLRGSPFRVAEPRISERHVAEPHLTDLHIPATRIIATLAPTFVACTWALALAFNPRIAIMVWVVIGAQELWFWNQRRGRNGSTKPPAAPEKKPEEAPESTVSMADTTALTSGISRAIVNTPMTLANTDCVASTMRVDSPVDSQIHEQVLAEVELDRQLTQQVERGRLDDGSEFVNATLRGRFAPGDRGLNLHLGFCPPLDSIPEVEFEQLEGPEVQVQVGQCQIFGLRLDLRLARPVSESDSAEVVLAVSAKTQLSTTA